MEKGQWQQVQSLEIPDNGLEDWLKDFGKVQLFRTRLKNQPRHYVVYLPETADIHRQGFLYIHDQHWNIEQYHRAIKQVCHIEHFQVRNERPIRNHIFAAILSYVHLNLTGYPVLLVRGVVVTSPQGLATILMFTQKPFIM